MSIGAPVTRGQGVVLTASVLLLAATSTVAIGATTGGFGQPGRGKVRACAAPALSGKVIDVSLTDMSGRHGMMSGDRARWHTAPNGRMRVSAVPQSAPSGVVSLRVSNLGLITHELVILPLADGQSVGTRNVDTDGTVDESASLGEVSATCAAGAGDGLTSGGTGWTTVTLPAGRYELVCNLPGHYLAGMFTELDVN